MAEPTLCCALPGGYCARTDALFNEPGVHVLDVGWTTAGSGSRLRRIPSGSAAPGAVSSRSGHGRRLRRLHDIPAFGAPVELFWRVRRWRCPEPDCQGGVFTEEHDLAPPRDKLTTRAAWWAVSVIARDTASVAAVARRLGVDWHTLWSAIKPLLRQLADDPARFEGVAVLGVDEHIVRHEALLFRMGVRDHHRRAVVAAG